MTRAPSMAQGDGSARPGNPQTMVLAAHALVYRLVRMFVDGFMRRAGIDDAQADLALLTCAIGTGLMRR